MKERKRQIRNQKIFWKIYFNFLRDFNLTTDVKIDIEWSDYEWITCKYSERDKGCEFQLHNWSGCFNLCNHVHYHEKIVGLNLTIVEVSTDP